MEFFNLMGLAFIVTIFFVVISINEVNEFKDQKEYVLIKDMALKLQKEISIALDAAEERPEGSIFIIPVRLEQCTVPRRLKHLQWVDLFDSDGYYRLLAALREARSKASDATT